MSRRGRASSPLTKPRPTVRGWALGAIGVVALVVSAALGRADVLFVGVFFTVVLVGAMISVTWDRPRLAVTRSFHPDMVAVGERVSVVTTVRNLSPRPSPAARWREFSAAGVGVQGRVPFPRLGPCRPGALPGSDTTVLRQDVLAERRGVHPIGPLVISRTDPFGIAYAEYAFGQPRALLVTPRVLPLAHGEFEVAHSEGAERELLRHSIPSADELIVREYRPGDPLRRVHWRATARYDTLMVRHEEQRGSPQAWLVLDTRGGVAGEPVFEAQLELIASVGVHLIGHGFAVSAVETAERQLRGRSGAGRSGTLNAVRPTFIEGSDLLFLADLADIEPGTSPRDDAVAELATGLRRAGRAVPVFVFLVGGIAELEHLAALRSMVDPAVAFLAASVPTEVEDVLGDAGWRCVPYTTTEDPASCWQRALVRQRRATGG